MDRADHLGPWPRITNTALQDERTANLESTESFNKCHLAEAFTCYLIDVDKRKTVEKTRQRTVGHEIKNVIKVFAT